MREFNLQKYLENPNQKVVTRAGRNVRIVCTNRRGLNVKPIAALITIPNGDEIIKTYWENGVATRGYEDNPNDLFFAPTKHEGWINMYCNSGDLYFSNVIYNNEQDAKKRAKGSPYYVATTKIEWED